MIRFDKGDVICGGTVLRFYDIFFVMNRPSMMSALVIRVIRPAYPLVLRLLMYS